MRSKNIRITISGLTGSGKSTIGKQLAKELEIDFYSMNNITWTKAKEMNLSIANYQNHLKQNPELERQNDFEFSEEMKKKKSFILEYQLGFHFIKKSFNIYLSVGNKVAFNRMRTKKVYDENYLNLSKEHVLKIIKQRNKESKERFIDLYNIDYTDTNKYDLVIDTNNISPGEIVRKIHLFLESKNSKKKIKISNFKRNSIESIQKSKLPFIGLNLMDKFKNKQILIKNECEKICFYSRKFAYEGIKYSDDIKYLRPYKCNLCEFWHLTHKKKRTLQPIKKRQSLVLSNLKLTK
jgi:predicted cytidylate kinase